MCIYALTWFIAVEFARLSSFVAARRRQRCPLFRVPVDRTKPVPVSMRLVDVGVINLATNPRKLDIIQRSARQMQTNSSLDSWAHGTRTEYAFE